MMKILFKKIYPQKEWVIKGLSSYKEGWVKTNKQKKGKYIKFLSIIYSFSPKIQI